MKNSDYHVASFAALNRLASLHILKLEKDAIFHDMDTVLMPAFKCRAAHLISSVQIIDVAVPELFELLAQRIVGIRPKKAMDRLSFEFANVALELFSAHPRKLRQIFWKATPDISAPIESRFELAARRCDDPAPGRDRKHAEIVM